MKGITQRNCPCTLHTNEGDLNTGAVNSQAVQKVTTDFGLNIHFNAECNPQFKGYRNHHFDVVSRALCGLQSCAQHETNPVSSVENCKLTANKGESKL